MVREEDLREMLRAANPSINASQLGFPQTHSEDSEERPKILDLDF
jgi:hypothetical protein